MRRKKKNEIYFWLPPSHALYNDARNCISIVYPAEWIYFVEEANIVELKLLERNIYVT